MAERASRNYSKRQAGSRSKLKPLSPMVTFVAVSTNLRVVCHHIQADRKREKIPKAVVVDPLTHRP